MSNPVLPPEIVDYILDLLHDEPETLKQCSLVSKSWVPRTRQYVFAEILFVSSSTLQSWNDTFPDHTNSPASHARTLEIDCYPEDLEGADWIRTFSGVVHLSLSGHPTLPFALFQGLSHNLKSLYVRFIEFWCQDLFDFICSFPVLENLDLVSERVLKDYGDNFHRLQTSPPLTGSLKLIVLQGGMESVPRYLLSMPNGLRFRELVFPLAWEGDLQWIQELVLKCSDTLECFDVKYRWSDGNPIDLSKATKLKDLIFRMRSPGAGRLIAMLETITSEHRDLRNVSIYLPFKRIPRGDAAEFRHYLGDDTYEKWLELDCLLLQFWESRSIRPKVVVTESLPDLRGTQEMKDRIGCLFPEITARGIIDLE